MFYKIIDSIIEFLGGYTSKEYFTLLKEYNRANNVYSELLADYENALNKIEELQKVINNEEDTNSI